MPRLEEIIKKIQEILEEEQKGAKQVEEQRQEQVEVKQAEVGIGQVLILDERDRVIGIIEKVGDTEKVDKLARKEELRRKRELERLQRKAAEIQKVLEEDPATGRIYLNTKCYGCKSVQKKELVGSDDRWLQFRCTKCGAPSYITKEDFQRFKDTRARILATAMEGIGVR